MFAFTTRKIKKIVGVIHIHNLLNVLKWSVDEKSYSISTFSNSYINFYNCLFSIFFRNKDEQIKTDIIKNDQLTKLKTI